MDIYAISAHKCGFGCVGVTNKMPSFGYAVGIGRSIVYLHIYMHVNVFIYCICMHSDSLQVVSGPLMAALEERLHSNQVIFGRKLVTT